MMKTINPSFPRRQESKKQWMPDQVRHDSIAAFNFRVNNEFIFEFVVV